MKLNIKKYRKSRKKKDNMESVTDFCVTVVWLAVDFVLSYLFCDIDPMQIYSAFRGAIHGFLWPANVIIAFFTGRCFIAPVRTGAYMFTFCFAAVSRAVIFALDHFGPDDDELAKYL